MSILIEIPGNPSSKTAQQKGEAVVHGHIHHYKKASVREAERVLSWQLKRFVPDEPLTGPIRLRVEWFFELKKQKREEWKITRPDLDNLEKGLLDVMTDLGFWRDDSQIVVKITTKKVVPVGSGKLIIEIEEIQDE